MAAIRNKTKYWDKTLKNVSNWLKVAHIRAKSVWMKWGRLATEARLADGEFLQVIASREYFLNLLVKTWKPVTFQKIVGKF